MVTTIQTLHFGHLRGKIADMTAKRKRKSCPVRIMHKFKKIFK